MGRQVVITGVGLLTSIGIGKDQFWARAIEGNRQFQWIDHIGTHGTDFGVIQGFDAADFGLPFRLTRKLDRFSCLALAASRMALDDANLLPEKEDVNRIGVMVGNAFGGMEFAERELRHLMVDGPTCVSPYQATAWFPAAPQGQISIFWGLKGYGKTMVADRASSHVALAYACRTIMSGKADVMLAGGTEALLSPFAYLCCAADQSGNELAYCADDYLPFDVRSKGMLIGEGSAILVLEEAERAERRSAPIYGELAGYAWNNDALHVSRYDSSGAGYGAAMTAAMEMADVAPEEVQFVCADGLASADADRAESRALELAFERSIEKKPIVSVPKTMFGHSIGAAGAIDAAATLMMMEKSVVLPTVGPLNIGPEHNIDLALKARETGINAALVCGRGQGGVNVALLLKERR